MQESKVFIGGGLDSDTATEYVANTDYRDALNVRIITSDGNSDGYVTSVTGNNLIPYTLPVGVNKGVGGEFFEEVMAAYIFIYNDQGRHRIVEVTYDEQVTTLFENLTDSNGVDVLPLLAGDNYVKDLNLVDGKYLYFIDCNAKPSVINIERLKAGDYGVVTEADFSIIKAPPLQPAGGAIYEAQSWRFVGDEQVYTTYKVNTYLTDESKTVNNLYNKTFQFRYQYIYWDNEPSAKSPMSDRYLPNPEEGDTFEVERNNVIRLSFYFPSTRVKEIVISFREDMGDWQYWKTVTREYFNSLPSVQVISSNTNLQPIGQDYKYVSFGINLNIYVTYFYNDGVYPFEDQLENDLAFDWVPRAAGALEVVNGNVLTLWDLFEGYEKPVIPDGSITLTKNKYTLEIQESDLFRMNGWEAGPETNPSSGAVLFSGNPSENDKLSVTLSNNAPGNPESYTYEYTVQAGESLTQAVQGLANVMNSAPNPAPSSYSGSLNAVVYQNAPNVGISFNTWTRNTNPPNLFNEYSLMLTGATVDLAAGLDIGSVQRILKKASSYQLALSYKDAYGRYFPLYTNDNLIVETDPDNTNLHIDEAQEIVWNISPYTAPPGAKSYQWLLSHNRTHSKWVQVSAKLDKASSGGRVWVWDITSLLNFVQENNGTIISYDYSQGDLARIVYRKTSKWGAETYFSDNVDKTLLIRSFEIEQDTEGNTVKYILKTTSPNGLSMSDISDSANVLLELYTPSLSTQDQIFYEIGPSYSIDNDGNHSVTSGTIREGDSFVKFRNYDWVGEDGESLWMLESQNISDYKVSNFHNYGRPRILNDVPEGVVSKVAGRYSDIYRKRDNTNMLNRFYAERLYESLSEEYGAVKHARMRDDILVIIQERKVAYVPVNRSIIEDLEAQRQISISDILLNPHTYSKSDNIGIGTRIMSLSSNRSQFYFVDPYKKLPVRAGLDGVKYIGGKFSTEMMNLIDNQKETVGYYDALNDEYVVRIGNVTYAYSEVHDKWVSRYSYLPEIGITATDKMFTVKLGSIYVHRKDSTKNTFYGVTTKPTIKFVINSNPNLIKTFQNISIQANTLVHTTVSGIETSLLQLSDLLAEDFALEQLSPTVIIYDREGVYSANFLRDKNTDLINGDYLKGNWMTIELTPEQNDWVVFRIGVDYQPSLVMP